MGDTRNDDSRVGFDRRLKLSFCGSKVTSDAGLLAYRELDEALGLRELSAEMLTDSRLGANKRHLLLPLLRQSIYSRLAGYEGVNDAERVCADPEIDAVKRSGAPRFQVFDRAQAVRAQEKRQEFASRETWGEGELLNGEALRAWSVSRLNP